MLILTQLSHLFVRVFHIFSGQGSGIGHRSAVCSQQKGYLPKRRSVRRRAGACLPPKAPSPAAKPWGGGAVTRSVTEGRGKARRREQRYISADAEIRYNFACGEISIYLNLPQEKPNSICLRLYRKRELTPQTSPSCRQERGRRAARRAWLPPEYCRCCRPRPASTRRGTAR